MTIFSFFILYPFYIFISFLVIVVICNFFKKSIWLSTYWVLHFILAVFQCLHRDWIVLMPSSYVHCRTHISCNKYWCLGSLTVILDLKIECCMPIMSKICAVFCCFCCCSGFFRGWVQKKTAYLASQIKMFICLQRNLWTKK